MEATLHTGQKLKTIFHEYNLTDNEIISLTPFEQSFLCKIYTSREIQPRLLQNFLYIINKKFDLNIQAENVIRSDSVKA